MTPQCRFVLVSSVVAVIAVPGCAKFRKPAPPPQPPAAHMTLAASADANPDPSGRPSPVVVRVYQLRGDAAFVGADFFGLFDDEQKALGPELISRAEYVLTPSERRTVDVPVAADARYVGVIAAFRDIRNADWRALVPTWREGTRNMSVAVGRMRIVLSLAEEAKGPKAD
jgi:type VI secretion system protein VasD